MTRIYPEFSVDRIKKPNRYFAVPFLGFLVKLLIVIPVNIELWFLRLVQLVISILNACNIFFRGRYWRLAYELNLGIMRLETNVAFYLFGLTDSYPGFSLKTTTYTLTMDFNSKPNRFFATPILGLIIRFILMIPYAIYQQIIFLAGFLAVLISWAFVLFTGVYPETTYELLRDSIRLDQAMRMYYLGMADTYPSWKISMNHKTLKIILFIAAIFFLFGSFFSNFPKHQQQRQIQKNYYLHTVEKLPSAY